MAAADVLKSADQRHALSSEATQVDVLATTHAGQERAQCVGRQAIDGPVQLSGLLLPPSKILASIAARGAPMASHRQVHATPTLEEILANLTAGAARSDHEHTAGRKLAGVRIAVRCDLVRSERKLGAEGRDRRHLVGPRSQHDIGRFQGEAVGLHKQPPRRR